MRVKTRVVGSDVEVHAWAGRVQRNKLASWLRAVTVLQVGVPKTKRSVRTINLDESVLAQLDYSHEWLFVNRNGGPVRIHGFRPRVWRPAVKRSGLNPTPRIHDLRHTCASWLIAAGVPLPVIQRRLGHESITTTIDLYGHLDRSADKLAADAIRRALDG
jgi:integrase